jgi:hypothetical protein
MFGKHSREVPSDTDTSGKESFRIKEDEERGMKPTLGVTADDREAEGTYA